MKKNIGSIERVVRFIIGGFIVSLVFWGPRSLWGLLGIIPILTAIFGWCPPYALLGISTRRKKSQEGV